MPEVDGKSTHTPMMDRLLQPLRVSAPRRRERRWTTRLRKGRGGGPREPHQRSTIRTTR